MTGPNESPEYYRDLEARLDAEFPIEGMRLDISTLRFQLDNRTKERDDARAGYVVAIDGDDAIGVLPQVHPDVETAQEVVVLGDGRTVYALLPLEAFEDRP